MDVAERRNGRLYLIGLAASLVGNSAMTLVAGIWVKSLTGSRAPGGARLGVPYAAAPGAVRPAGEVWLIDGAMAIYGLEAVLLDPAENALFAEIFGDAFRRRINGRRLAIQETGRLVAPLLGAGLFAV